MTAKTSNSIQTTQAPTDYFTYHGLEPICVVSNSQRHKASSLAGTQNPQHRSQPAKELAFLLGLVNSL